MLATTKETSQGIEMASRKQPTISANRAAEIFRDTLSVRRINWLDNQFPKMTDVWEFLAADNPQVRIKRYNTDNEYSHKRAAVVALDELIALTASNQFWDRACQGALFQNFVLAHEMGHLILDHHASGAVVKNFALFDDATGVANIPPTVEELEANYAAVFFQCGVTLLAPGLNAKTDAFRIAARAFSDPHYVEKAIRLCQLEAF